MNKVISFTPQENINAKAHRKEGNLDRQWSLIDLRDGSTLVTVRTYWPAQTCFACVWTSSRIGYGSGSSKAGGGGYCKQSAAIEDALRSAGFRFEEPFGGHGLGAVDDALEAIARHAGLRKRFAIIKAHS